MQERGYNQAALLAKGIADIIKKPVEEHVAVRTLHTVTQTGKDRTSRWQTVQHAFAIHNKEALAGKHILLVDDIVTTGATLEACGAEILSVDNLKLSIATAAHTL